MPKTEVEQFRNRDLSQHLEMVARAGGSQIPEFLDRRTLVAIQPFLANLDFQDLESAEGNVYKRLSHVTELTEYQKGTLALLGSQVRDLIARHPNLDNWDPNEYSIQRYDKASFISPHRDTADHKGLVIILSLSGISSFELRERRDETPFAAWKLTPGDAVLLGAKDFLKDISVPYHSVGGAMGTEDRISIKMAYNPKLPQGFNLASRVE